mgnify:CR=1 FL=1
MIENSDAQKSPSLCIGILTMNEERRIKECIESASFGNSICVVDSGSSDETCHIAEQAGAKVYIYEDWKGFAIQRNRLLSHVDDDYIFFLDADEIITPELAIEIQDAIATGYEAAWIAGWTEISFGRNLNWMKSTGGRRLFKTNSISRFQGEVHEEVIMKNSKVPVLKLKNKLLHYSRETVHGSLLKLAQYSHLGALKRSGKGKTGGVFRGIFSGVAIFIRLYFFRRGILCGAEGFLFCFFIALECFFRYAALKYDLKAVTKLLPR